VTDLDRFPPQNEEGLRTLRQESCKLMDQDMLNLIGLLDLDADTDGVDAGLNQDTLVLVARNGQGLQQDLGGCLGLDLWDVMSLGGLGSKVGEGERGGQAAAYALQVGSEGLRLSGG
jgi:hypothetical protein